MRVLAVLALLALSTPALASPLNPWGVHVGDKVVAITPFVYGGPDGAGGAWVSPFLYGQYGVTERFELLAGVGATVVPPASFDSVELMPRFFFSDTTGVALHATWSPGQIALAPEWHGVYELGPIGLTVNAGWAPTIGLGSGGGFSAGTVFAKVAPEYYFNDATSVFVELDPTVDVSGVADPFYMEVVPGISTSVAETHYFAVGVAIPVTGFDPAGIYGGAWYSIAFGGSDDG